MNDSVARFVRMFDTAEFTTFQARAESEQARDYYDNKQLTSEETATMKKRKQPIVIQNLIQPKIDYLCGLERQTRTDPKVYPRTPMHDQDAEAVTDALRYVADDQRFDTKRSQVFQQMLVEGFGGVEITVQKVGDQIDPSIEQIDWDRLFFDPHSCKPDFSDARFLGFVTWMDREDAEGRWEAAKQVLAEAFDRGARDTGDTYGDKPKRSPWTDRERNRVRVVTMYHIEKGAWHRVVFTQGGELEENGPSPFLDADGEPECGLIFASAYVDRDNDRYGIVRSLISLQDEVNKRRSKFLHLANSRPVRVSPTVATDPEKVRKEMARPDGVFIGEQGDVEDLTNHTMAAGHFNLLAEAKDAIERVGPNATMQGKSGENQSGRAILAMQQGGMTEIAPLLDALRDFNIRVFRAVWNRVRQYWTAERWVRVTDDEDNVRFVGLNTTRGQIAAMKVREALKAGKIDQQTAAAYGQQIALDPSMMQPANHLAEIDVDILIDEQMDAPTLQAQQFEQLTSIIPSAPQQYHGTMFEMLVEASSLRDKDKLKEIIEQAKQGPDPMQQAAAQLEMAEKQAGIEKTKSETVENLAQAEAIGSKSQLDAFNAGVTAGL